MDDPLSERLAVEFRTFMQGFDAGTAAVWKVLHDLVRGGVSGDALAKVIRKNATDRT